MDGRLVGALAAVAACAAGVAVWGPCGGSARDRDDSAARSAAEATGPAASSRVPEGRVAAPPRRGALREQAVALLESGVRGAVREVGLRRRRADGGAPRQRPGGRVDRPSEAPSRGRLALLVATGVLRREAGMEIAGVAHHPFALWKDGLPILNRRGRIHERDGRPIGTSGGTSFPPLEPGARVLGRDAAIARARALTGVAALRGEPRAEPGWFARPGGTAPAWRVSLPASEPLASFQVTLDARTGDALANVDLLRSADGSGFVFKPNPVEARAQTLVPLRALDGSGFLAGEFTRVLDLRAVEAFAPGLEFAYPPGDPRLAQTAVYHGLTETGSFASAHGFPPFAAPLLAFTNLADPLGGEYNNAFYDPLLQLFGFGNGDGTLLRNLALDLDVPAHEMGHHVFERLVTPEVFAGDDPVLAMHEGVADTFAALVIGDAEIGESVLPGRRFLRTLQNRARYPGGFDPDPHVTGLIYGGANWELSRAMKAVFPRLLIAALPFLPPDAFPEEYRDALVEGDRAVNGGRFASRISQVFRARGFDEVALPPEFQGFVLDGIPETGFLQDTSFDFWVFQEFPGSTRLRFEIDGSGDADLLVAHENSDPRNPSTFVLSEGPTSQERIELTRTTPVSVDDGDVWFVLVGDYPDRVSSSYTLSVTATLPADALSIDGDPALGEILELGEIDYFVFSGASGQVVRVEARDLDGALDPLVAVLDIDEFDLLAWDDDSGPDRDAEIQGVRLPRSGRFAIAVLSLIADVDPRIGTGPYAVEVSTCDNRGADGDGDGLVDLCDDDDDGDEFKDAEDTSPSDPERCADLDADTCDDCASGEWDFFEDGPDFDRDGSCDPDDRDDDNDGCADAQDPQAYATSTDADLDFLGDDCDVCPEVPDPLQADSDADGLGNACESCARLAWTEPATDPPDQNPSRSLIEIRSADAPGRTSVRASGGFNPAGPSAVDPVASGLFLRLADRDGWLSEWHVPPGLVGAGCDPRGDGWSVRLARGLATWTYSNRSGALPAAGCAPGSAGGLRRVLLAESTTRLGYDVQVDRAALGRPLAQPRFLHFDLVLGSQPGGGVGSPEGDAGACAESVLWLARPDSSCKASLRNGVVTTLQCRSR